MGSVENDESGEARGQLERARVVTRSSLEEARRSLRELRGSPLNARPLGEALMALGRAMASDTGVRVHVQVRAEDDLSLPAEAEEELYRIASEALTNVRRHAAAKEVQVTLTRSGRSARLIIEDDGRGFEQRARSRRWPELSAGAAAQPGSQGHGAAQPASQADAAAQRAPQTRAEGFGIAGMRERAALIGGRFALSSRPGRGTQVSVTVPLERVDAANRPNRDV
jgi:signal transduction histidine kinase